ncbi:TetR/AcrR family transcriptional regulator [Haloechinothrix sp. LS1_15]|uniref:TetR/AcrR family transcriptional regulator n=1 Tax=Haloechinothrix sp. LS1_15 TaxID=2652248 RepID=UPI002944DA9D|nr:TetR/AcrR family transcriptional regulator [Haloechinothrix sp. LS1_15]MDV6014311.1 TetR/AcrR family transcriptional regulator [Haloechinothrix sp. LS1_15]
MADTASSPGPETSRLEPDERRDQILQCAQRLFSEHGVGAVSNTDIARAAGISRGLLNHYFGSRRELYRDVVRRMMDVPPVPVPEYVPGASVADRVAQSLDGWLELLSRNRSIWLTATGIAGCGGDEELEAIIDRARDRAVARAIEVTGLGPAVRDHPEIHAMLRGFSGMAEATTREWLRHGRLTRKQVHVLLESTLLTIINDVIPDATAVCE